MKPRQLVNDLAPLARPRRLLFPLMWSTDRQEWGNHVQIPFKPRGLMIWDAPPGAEVVHIVAGPRLELVATLGPVPARWFSIAQSYEQVAKALDEGQEPPAWAEWNFLDVGQYLAIRLELNGRRLAPDGALQLVIWGEALLTPEEPTEER